MKKSYTHPIATSVFLRRSYLCTWLTGLKTLSAKNAALLDKDLMSVGAFSLDQLMELAGLSISQAGNLTKFGFN
jgi:hypothetical protein